MKTLEGMKKATISATSKKEADNLNVKPSHEKPNLSQTQVKRKNKHKTNKAHKRKALKILSRHKKYLQEVGWYKEEHQKSSLPSKPSYSIMHALKDGSQYSCILGHTDQVYAFIRKMQSR